MKELPENTYSHILKYTSLFGSVQGLNILIGLVRNKCVALLLGPSGMGLASLFQTMIGLVQQTTSLGVSFSAVQHISELFESGDERRILHFIKVVRAWSLITGLIGVMFCLIAISLFNRYVFTEGNYLWQTILLSPLVFMLAISGGETAILKGVRQLKPLAYIQMYNAIAALLIAVPMYYFLGIRGIVPVLVILGLVSMCLIIRYSNRLYPIRLKGAFGVLGEGMDMIRLGVSFTIAGILGSGADFSIRAILNHLGGLEEVGLYNTGFTMTMLYSGVIFSAMEVDFFPRLSSVNNQRELYNDLINKQAVVSLLLIGAVIPMVIILLPVIIPLLTSSEFLPVIDMMRLMALSLYFRSVNLCIEYLSLAKGDSKSYLFLEFAYNVALVILVFGGYQYIGLSGAGWAFLVLVVLNFVMVLNYMHVKYQVSIQSSLIKHLFIHILFGVITYMITQITKGATYWLIGLLVSLTAACYSFYVLNKLRT